MARFGLLALNKGNWNNNQIVNETYFNESITSSQAINPSYGYLWWLLEWERRLIPPTLALLYLDLIMRFGNG